MAVARAMDERTDIILVNDPEGPFLLPDLLLQARDGDTWSRTDTGTGILTLVTSQEAWKALVRREDTHKERD